MLGAETVGAHDNFFERGGHSLLAVQLLSRLRQIFAVELSLRDFLEDPTVSRLAASSSRPWRRGQMARPRPWCRSTATFRCRLRSRSNGSGSSINWNPGSRSYHIPAAVKLVGRLDVPALERALNEVVRRHEVLRTTLVADGGIPRQVIAERLELPLAMEDLSGFPEDEREFAGAKTAYTTEAERPFDLVRGPLVRAGLLRLGEREHIAMVTMHHAISDGWSIGILVRELSALYRSFRAGRAISAPRAGDPVRRLRGLAAELAPGRGPRRRNSITGCGSLRACPISSCPRIGPGRRWRASAGANGR